MKKKIIVKADQARLRDVTEFVDQFLLEKQCPAKVQTVIDIVLEEIFINIASYAYSAQKAEGQNTAEIECEIADDGAVQLIFIDNGVRYNPLEKRDPNVNVSFEERNIGGLGIYMVKNMVDNISYEYVDGKNILKIKKCYKKDEEDAD